MSRAYIALGSNVGRRESHLAHALHRFGADRLSTIEGISSVYETRPVGFPDQPRFLNMVVAVETVLEPEDLLSRLQWIEAERGRQRQFRNAPRTLDLDILLYEDRVVRRPNLTIPHPRMLQRDFVLRPLLEIAPDLVDPETGKRYEDSRPPPASDTRILMPGERLLEGRWD